MFDRRVMVGEQGIVGVGGVLGLDLFGAVSVVDASFVTQLALLIENECMRRGLGTIGSGDGLRFAAVQIGVAQVLVGYANLHFFQSVADIGGIQLVDANGFGVVALNRDDGYPTVAVVVI